MKICDHSSGQYPDSHTFTLISCSLLSDLSSTNLSSSVAVPSEPGALRRADFISACLISSFSGGDSLSWTPICLFSSSSLYSASQLFFPSLTHLIWFSEVLASTVVDGYSSRLKRLFTVWKTRLLLPRFTFSSSSLHIDSSCSYLSLRSIFCTSVLNLLYSTEDCALVICFRGLSAGRCLWRSSSCVL